MKLYGQPETFETVSNSTLLLNEMALGTVPKFGVWFRVEIENNPTKFSLQDLINALIYCFVKSINT